ncbi:MAG: D-2-hydroxyacid dehydrogenase, partial [Acidobacteria bacterium]|nr:D-2-hydroxyacid dehydrogenase [Acidobacteriota bacterium]
MTRSADLPIKKLLILTHHRLDLWIAPEWFSDRIRKLYPQLEVVRLNTYEGIEDELEDADVAFTASLRPEQFRVAPRLRWVHSPAAAVHQLLFPEFVASDVVLTNAREVHGPVVAEHVLGLMFALAKKIPESVRYQHMHIWAQGILWSAPSRPRELQGATVGLVGVGSIGRNVAKHASHLGMHVIAVREHTDREKPEFVDQVLPTQKLNEMLELADYLVLSPPLTPETRGMIARDQLSRMRPGSFLINVGRGPLIHEEDLWLALRERRIAGAALDVFENEPLPADSPLWDLDNLLITPHTAGMT